VKKLAIILAVAIVAVLVAVSVIRSRPQPETVVPVATEEPSPVASLSEANGIVRIVRGPKKVVSDADEGSDLLEGDQVVTGTGANATISFVDDHFLSVDEKTTVVIRTIKVDPAAGTFTGRVKLVSGKLFASFAKLATSGSGFAVESGSVVAAVKGTTFAVENDGKQSTVAVDEGVVATSVVDAQGKEKETVDVQGGQETSAARGGKLGKARAIPGKREWMRKRMGDVRQSADKYRGMRQSGELGKLRNFRREAREGKLDPNSPEAKEFMSAHPEFKDRLEKQAERHKKMRERREKVQGKKQGLQGRRKKAVEQGGKVRERVGKVKEQKKQVQEGAGGVKEQKKAVDEQAEKVKEGGGKVKDRLIRRAKR